MRALLKVPQEFFIWEAHNEVVCWAIDRMLGIARVPPVGWLSVPVAVLEDAVKAAGDAELSEWVTEVFFSHIRRQRLVCACFSHTLVACVCVYVCVCVCLPTDRKTSRAALLLLRSFLSPLFLSLSFFFLALFLFRGCQRVCVCVCVRVPGSRCAGSVTWHAPACHCHTTRAGVHRGTLGYAEVHWAPIRWRLKGD